MVNLIVSFSEQLATYCNISRTLGALKIGWVVYIILKSSAENIAAVSVCVAEEPESSIRRSSHSLDLS